MAVKLKYTGPPRGKYAKDVRDFEQPIARAVTKVFRTAAKEIEREGRQRIAAGGLSRRFISGFRVFAFPRRQFSMRPEIKGTHRIGFINIFETGGTIHGRPLLWIPLKSAPAKIGGKRITPRLYISQVGPLISIQRPGKPPLLAGQALRAPAAGRPASLTTLKTGARRAASRRGRRPIAVPLFVGARQTRIPKRLNVSPVYDKARAEMAGRFDRQMAEELVR